MSSTTVSPLPTGESLERAAVTAWKAFYCQNMIFLVCAVTLHSGRTHMMQGAVHLVLLAACQFLAFVRR